MFSNLFQIDMAEKLKAMDVPIILFGAGGKGADALSFLNQHNISPACFCDNNPELNETMYYGLPVYSYAAIREKFSKYVVLITMISERAKQVIDQLEQQKESNPVIPFCIPFKLENILYQPDKTRMADYEKIYQNLADKDSQILFSDFLSYKLTGNGLNLLSKIDGDDFFDKKLIPEREDHVFVDVGAYTGDTLLRFYAFCRGKYQKIIAMEPDQVNFQKLQSLVQNGKLSNIQAEQIGGWSHKDKLRFFTSKNGNWNANLTKFPLEAHNDHIEYIETELEVNSVDEILFGNKATLIKINTMAADYKIVQGCRVTMQKFKPTILLDYGSGPEDILELPLLLLKIRPDYRFFLRQKRIFGDSKTVLYAI